MLSPSPPVFTLRTGQLNRGLLTQDTSPTLEERRLHLCRSARAVASSGCSLTLEQAGTTARELSVRR